MELDWRNLGFEYLPTNGFVRSDFADGKWSDPVFSREEHFTMHISATALHYGQSCFEGLKAFRTADGRVVIFRPQANAGRMFQSAGRICMECPEEELFVTACVMAVQQNLEFVPPYGTGASLYIRPLLFGTQPVIGVNASTTYSFVVFVTPVGPYYKSGFTPVEAVVIDNYDRAAALGTGKSKVAGNYAASMKPGLEGKKLGYPIILYTDPVYHKYVDEFGTSNFFGITDKGEYLTPDSTSILPSITNDSLQVLSRGYGLNVRKEPIELESIDRFMEVGACGTAAVITPIYAVNRGSRKWTFGSPAKAGPTLKKLFEHLQGIQYGVREDEHGWLVKVTE